MKRFCYLDDYNTIEIQVKRGATFLPPFTLHSNSHSIALRIVHQYEDQIHHFYGISFDYEIEIGQEYYISDKTGKKEILQYRFITKTKRFDTDFAYDGELGPIYDKESTLFKLWAPTAAKVALLLNGETHEMERKGQGVYSIVINGDLDCAIYNYLVTVNGVTNLVIDPYAKSCTPNATSSIVIDKNKARLPKQYALKPLRPADYLIYELSVYDYSNNPWFVNKGKYLAFEEKAVNDYMDKIGLDYIKSLGVSHLQLMPILDFATKDEMQPHKLYNWGYDPVQYFVSEGSYLNDLDNPYSRINEVVAMVDAIHSHGMRVVLDVVYNHVYEFETNCLNQIVPYYYFVYKDRVKSNGSMCGNDLDTPKYMVFSLISNSVKYLVETFCIDGLRMDLMGIISIQLVENIAKIGRNIVKDFAIYGEGWHNSTLIDDLIKTTFEKAKQIPTIGFFNDYFRDNIMGSSSYCASTYGYALGDVAKTYYAIDVLKGHHDIHFDNPLQSINYLECHDGMTLSDKIVKESGKVDKNKILLAMAMLILAQGIPFIHMGQEFMRSKNMQDNTYLGKNNVNFIDWNLISKNKDIVDKIRQIISFRQSHPELFFASFKQIEKNVKIEEFYSSIVYYVGDYVFYFNGNNHEMIYPNVKGPDIILSNNASINCKNCLKLEASSFAIVKV